jgi:hypothetical protein
MSHTNQRKTHDRIDAEKKVTTNYLNTAEFTPTATNEQKSDSRRGASAVKR